MKICNIAITPVVALFFTCSLFGNHSSYNFEENKLFLPPACTPLTFPLNGSVDIPIDTNIVWEEENVATGYILRIGTTPMGTDIANDIDVGNVLSYDHPVDLAINTTYYVLITPYNLDGPAVNCEYDVFTTGTGVLADGISDLVSCEGAQNFDGLTTTDLTIKDDEITQGNPDLSVFYYLSQMDADLAMDILTDPENFQNTTNPQRMWVRIIDNTDPLLVIPSIPFDLVVEVGVNANNTSVLTLPDTFGTGFNTFDLNNAINQITNGDLTLATQFYENRTDAVNNNTLNELSAAAISAYTNTINPQELFVRVSNAAGCDEVVRLILRVGCDLLNNNTPVLNSIPPFVVCEDSDGIDGNFIGSFNLNQKRGRIYTEIGLSPDVTITFHTTEAGANAVPPTDEITGTINSGSEFLYVRIDGGAQGCSALVTTMVMIVNELPVVVMEPEYILCLNNLPAPLRINAPFGFDRYEWRLAGDNTIITTNSTLNATVPGTYNLTVFETNYGVQCENDTDFEVVPSNLATVVNVDVQDIMENNIVTVTVEGEGDYEYILDNPRGTYQDSPTFEDVRPGFRTIYIRDKNGCGITPEEVAVIGYPKYFTPNGDGFHDTWQLAGIDNSIPSDTKIYIYDRYGRFIKQIRTDSPGWDGLVNGKAYPSTDYWFNVELDDGRAFKGHFSLKR